MQPRSALRMLAIFAFAVALLPAAGCSQKRLASKAPAPPQSAKLNPFVYYEVGPTAFFGVDTRSAQYHKAGSLLPIGIGLSNLGMKPITFNRESFILQDAEGNRYPVVSHQEFLDYDRSRTDAQLADSFVEIMRLRYATYTYAPWRLFPFKGEDSTVANSIELGRNQYTVGYLYFPDPKTGVKKKAFSLLINAAEYPETFVVHFVVP